MRPTFVRLAARSSSSNVSGEFGATLGNIAKILIGADGVVLARKY